MSVLVVVELVEVVVVEVVVVVVHRHAWIPKVVTNVYVAKVMHLVQINIHVTLC